MQLEAPSQQRDMLPAEALRVGEMQRIFAVSEGFLAFRVFSMVFPVAFPIFSITKRKDFEGHVAASRPGNLGEER